MADAPHQYRIIFTPYHDGSFPDVTGTPLNEWFIVRSQLAAGQIIEIDARKEFSLRGGGSEPPLSRRISWRQYFSWLADVEENESMSWPELRERMYNHLSELFGWETVDVVSRPLHDLTGDMRPAQPVVNRCTVVHHPQLESAGQNNRKNGFDLTRSLIPDSWPGRTFNELHQGGVNGEE